MSAARKKPAPKRKPAAAKKSGGAKKQASRENISSKLLASNYFAHQQKRNRNLNGKRRKTKKRSWLQHFSAGWARWHRRRAVKKDKRLRKRASYLADLPQTPFRRFLHKLHPKKIFGYVFSIRGLLLFVRISLTGLLIGLTSIAGLYLYYRQDVPKSIASLQSCISGQSTQYYDRTGKILLWSSKSDFDCQPVHLDKVSPHLLDALIAVEDQDFYEHNGVKISSIARAAINNIFNAEAPQGGSTITQQYVKNAVLQDHQRTYDRKIKEIILAIEIERTFEKDEILTAYLNTVAFGSVYGGIEAASQGYLGKSAANLTLDEAALLVAALPAPTTYWNSPKDHLVQQRRVLKRMLDNGSIDRKAYDKAIAVDIIAKIRTSHEQYENIRAPHFILEAEKRLTEELCGVESEELSEENCDNLRLRGYKVVTTLDIGAQDLAEEAVAATIPFLSERGFDNAAMVAVDTTTGKVIAHVGSRDFKYEGFGQTNTVTHTRDPGSSFKLFDYGALIENETDWGPGSVFYDYETTFDNRGWTPDNYTGLFSGPITMRRALGHSLNIPAVKAMYITDMETVHDFARQAGIRTKFPCKGGCGLASAFGGGVEVRLDELANAYATFSRRGVYMPLTYIDQVLDSEGKLLRQWRQKPERVFRTETAYLLNHMLADESSRYTVAYNLDPSLEVTMALKTGTDDNYINNHVIGYTKTVAVSGWIGHHDESVTHDSERNTTLPKATLLKTFMEGYHRSRDITFEQKNHWARPAGIKKVRIDTLTGYQVPDEAEGDAAERARIDIFPSWYTPTISPLAQGTETIDIDTVSGKIATVCTPRRAIKRVEGIKIKSEIDLDDEFYDNWFTPIIEGLEEAGHAVFTGAGDNLHDCDDQLPTLEVVSQPENCASICSIEILVTAGTFDLSQLNILQDSQVLEDGEITLEGRSQRLTYNYRPLDLLSSPETRGLLLLEVVDEGLYDASIDVLLNIDGFPIVSQPTENRITLTEATLSADGLSLQVAWQGRGRDPELVFDGDCRRESILYLQPNSNFVEVDISAFPSGECEVFIRYDLDLESNREYFNPGQIPLLEPLQILSP